MGASAQEKRALILTYLHIICCCRCDNSKTRQYADSGKLSMVLEGANQQQQYGQQHMMQSTAQQRLTCAPNFSSGSKPR